LMASRMKSEGRSELFVVIFVAPFSFLFQLLCSSWVCLPEFGHGMCSSFLFIIWLRQPKLSNLLKILDSVVDLGDFPGVELEKDVAQLNHPLLT
jgi:hypothetical protein